MEYDVCIIGSGAGAGPVAYTLALQGKKVLVLEKGGWFKESDFTKDEIAVCRRNSFTPDPEEEPQVVERLNDEDEWEGKSNAGGGSSFWNGNMVGGSSNLMSGFFHRMKPVDFHLKSEFGTDEGDHTVDWPLQYEDMEPYYLRTELIVGISGKVVSHPQLEPRSTPDFPFPPLAEHPVSSYIDQASQKLGFHAFPLPRAIISRPHGSRQACSYSGYCGSYGCTTGAKGSARAALLDIAMTTGNCEIRPDSHVFRLVSDRKGKVTEALYFDKSGKKQRAEARIFVVACQAVETSRLLLLSKGPKFPGGLANNHGQVGKNLIFSAGGIGSGVFTRSSYQGADFDQLRDIHLFVNRALQDWYVIDDPKTGRIKGGTIDFLMAHANPIRRANREKYNNGKLQWGSDLKRALETSFRDTVQLNFEIFCDWTPNENCFVELDGKVKDKFGMPVARIRTGYHPRDLVAGRYLADKSELLLEAMKMENIRSNVSGAPPPNLMAGGCRFGKDPATSVLDVDCRAHEVENLFVTDGSFMPTGGSVTYTWTIYANAFRVADKIAAQL